MRKESGIGVILNDIIVRETVESGWRIVEYNAVKIED
jgi:hypothetical protein